MVAEYRSKEEIWRPVEDYPNYQISNMGRLWSNYSRRILECSKSNWGYIRTCLSRNGKLKSTFVHHLVLDAFIGKRSEGMVACHNDGNKENNCIENLRWDTVKSNSYDKIIHGTTTIGERNPQSKLTEEKVKEIRQLRKIGYSYSSLGRIFGVDRVCIYNAVIRKTWKHVK